MPYAIFPTVLGACGIAWTDTGVSGFALPPAEARQFGESDADVSATLPEEIAAIVKRVRLHLEGTAQDFGDVRYDFSGVSSFQRDVYVAALRVGAGETRTYGWLAEQAGRSSRASRAVGGALGSNPWPLLVPCHRFVGASGKLTGFSAPGGLATKRKLLALEGAELLAEE